LSIENTKVLSDVTIFKVPEGSSMTNSNISKLDSTLFTLDIIADNESNYLEVFFFFLNVATFFGAWPLAPFVGVPCALFL
jgi:hypothetical protein